MRRGSRLAGWTAADATTPPLLLVDVLPVSVSAWEGAVALVLPVVVRLRAERRCVWSEAHASRQAMNAGGRQTTVAPAAAAAAAAADDDDAVDKQPNTYHIHIHVRLLTVDRNDVRK